MFPHEEIVEEISGEYLEMAGVATHAEQAARLCRVDRVNPPSRRPAAS
jgi:hypothetical protein